MRPLPSEPLRVLWRQSTIATYLRCPRWFFLEFVQGRTIDHSVNGFAAPAGTAVHKALELVVQAANAGRELAREDLTKCLTVAFADAICEDQDRGRDYDPEQLSGAIEKLLGEHLDALLQIAQDPRLQAVEWIGCEVKFEVRDGFGRCYGGSIDLVGVARHSYHGWGHEGRDPVDLAAGDVVVLDWKSGDNYPRSKAERDACFQLGYYRHFLPHAIDHPAIGAGARVRTFIGAVQDARLPVRPRDASGNTIPSKLPKQLNPAYAAALGVSAEQAEAMRKRPRDAAGEPIPKWLPEQANPAYELACSRPRGPVFRECRVDAALAIETARSAIRGAEAGLYPASGALNGSCAFCPFRTTCTHDEDPTHEPD